MGWLPDWLLLWLAGWGLISMVAVLVLKLARLRALRQPLPTLYILVLVQNQEQQIEGFVRELATDVWESASFTGPCELVLVDAASTDTTPQILERLVRKYPRARLVRLNPEQARTACEAALFLCQGPVAVTVDLRGRDSAGTALKALHAMW